MLNDMLFLQTAIKHVFIREGIGATVVRVKQGPMTITYQLQLDSASRQQVAAVKNLGETIAQEARQGPVRVALNPEGVSVEFPSPQPMTPSPAILAQYSRGANVVIGMDRFDEPVSLNLVKTPNTLFVGPPLHGKTSAMRSILYQVIKGGGVEYVIIAERMVSWKVFTRLQGCIGVFGTAKLGQEMLLQLEAQMEAHATAGTKFFPRVILVLDDLMSLLKACPDLKNNIQRLASAGGQVGIMILMGTQSAGSRDGAGGMIIEDLFISRVIYRMAGASAAFRASGVGESDIDLLTDNPGDALFMRGNEKVRVATAYVTDDELINELPPFTHREPSHQAFAFTPSVEAAPKLLELKEEVPAGLPVIKPARVPTEDEIQQIMAYLSAHPISQNKLLIEVYGNKGSGPKSKMKMGFGERWEEFYPPRTDEVD